MLVAVVTEGTQAAAALCSHQLPLGSRHHWWRPPQEPHSLRCGLDLKGSVVKSWSHLGAPGRQWTFAGGRAGGLGSPGHALEEERGSPLLSHCLPPRLPSQPRGFARHLPPGALSQLTARTRLSTCCGDRSPRSCHQSPRPSLPAAPVGDSRVTGKARSPGAQVRSSFCEIFP